MKAVSRCLVAVLAAVCGGVLPAGAQTTPSTGAGGQTYAYPGVATPRPGDKLEAWIGYGLNRPGNGWADFGFAGFTVALNQTNLLADGWVLRGEAAGGVYTQGFNFQDIALMFGYRMALGQGYLTFFGGPEFERFSTPTNQGFFLAGPYGGGKAAIEYQIPGHVGGFELYSIASYSSIADAFSVNVRPGWRVTENLRIGPEGGYFHNRFYEEGRAGGFVAYWFQGYGTLWLGGGAELPISQATLVNRVSDGYYGYVSWSINR
jgi:hypothetical protein